MNTNPDPDPIRIRIQSGSRALMTKNWKKITAEKFFLIFFWSKTAIYLSLGLHKVCPSYRRSLQLSKEAIQHFKTWTFTKNFLLLWVIFALLDPDPDPQTRLNPDPIRIRIRNPAGNLGQPLFLNENINSTGYLYEYQGSMAWNSLDKSIKFLYPVVYYWHLAIINNVKTTFSTNTQP